VTSTPVLIALAAVVALVTGIVIARASATARGTYPVPTAIRVLARVPSVAVVRTALGGTVDGRAVHAAGLTLAAVAPLLPRARAGGLVAGVVAGALAAVVALPMVVLAPVLGVLGRTLPDRVLHAMARRRRDLIVDALPDLLDLMVICVEAGMALDPALGLAADRLGGPLGDEVRATLDDQALGTPRRSAYRALAGRTGSDDVARLVAALLQAEELGTPLATALAGQAESLRAARRQAARDRAARAAPRIQLVVALVMVPGALLLILGIMVIELAGQVGAVVGGA
jgi:tight adherence protein C